MLNAWILGWVSDAAVTSPGELWDAPIFHPHTNTLAFSEHLVGIALLVAPVYWLTGDAILTYNVAFLLGFAFLGWSTFLLVRAITGSDDAACIAGLAVMCSPYFASSQVARLQMLSSGWSLLAFFWLHRWLEAPTTAALAAFTFCWAFQISSNVYLGLFLVVPVGVLLAASLLRASPALTWRRAGGLLAAAAVVVAVAAVPLQRYAEAREELGLAHSMDEVRRYSASVRSYASVWHERHTGWLWREDASDRALFPGVLLAALAIVGATVALRRPRGAWRAGHAPAVYLFVVVVVFLITLGPEPRLGAATLGFRSPYAWLLDAVPGVDGIRAPGRFAVFVVLGLGVLAGVGAAAVLAGRRRGARLAAVAVVAAVALWDGHRNYDWLALLPEEVPSDTAAYEWLSKQPPGVVLERPVVTHQQAQRPYAGGSVTLRYQLAALRHGHTLVNGSSGFVTPLVGLLQSHASPFATLDTVDDALRVLRTLGTRHVVVHHHEFLPDALGHADQVMAAMRADTTQVEEVREFGTTTVLTLAPAPPAAPPARSGVLADSGFVVSASDDTASLDHLTDGDLTTHWRAPQDGSAWLGLQLARARIVHGVKMTVPHFAVADYPHHLRVVGTDPEGVEHVLFDAATVYDAAITAVFEPTAPGLRLTWAPLALSALRLEQPVSAYDRPWSIYELHLLGEDGRADEH